MQTGTGDYEHGRTMDERYISLLARSDRVLAGRPVADAVAKVRAIIGVPKVPDSEKAAQAALDKLRSYKVPDPKELAALELVIRMMRPAPLSHKGTLAPLPSAEGSSTYNPITVKLWDGFREKVKPFIYSIGRLDRTSGSNPEIGTGFLVADNVLLTNRHVLEHLSFGAYALEEGQAVVRFYQESGVPDPTPNAFPITGVVAIHPTFDIALLQVGLVTKRPVPPFESATIAKAIEIAAIGYPFKDQWNPLFADAVYGGKYGVKRAALGEIMDVAPGRLYHDCSTLGGSSGSPLFSLETACIVGVHYTGSFMYRNEAISAADAAAFVEASAQQ